MTTLKSFQILSYIVTEDWFQAITEDTHKIHVPVLMLLTHKLLSYGEVFFLSAVKVAVCKRSLLLHLPHLLGTVFGLEKLLLFTLRMKRRLLKILKKNSETLYWFWVIGLFPSWICLQKTFLSVAENQPDTVLHAFISAKSLYSWSLPLATKGKERHVWSKSHQASSAATPVSRN